jgi:outer membrane protein
MNNYINKRSFLYSSILLILFNGIIAGQNINNSQVSTLSDSLSLKDVIQKVVSTYPAVKAAEEAVNNADARIGLAKTSYNPVVDMIASYSNLGPVTKLTLPDFGTFQLYPGNNYSASVAYQQLVYDFGRTKKNVELENENKDISKQTVEQVKQRMAELAVINFYSLVFLQTAIKIKDQQLADLNEQLQYVEKRMASGSATEYEVLTTKVRISSVESQKVDLSTALTTQQASLNSLMGTDHTVIPLVKKELAFELPDIPADSIMSFAYKNRDEVLINEKKTLSAGLRYDLTRLQTKPMLNFIANAGAKNGYIPELNKLTPNYVVGLGLRVPILDGNKTRYNLAQAQSAIISLSYESDYTKRNISNEVIEAEAFMTAAEKKVNQYELQLQQAVKAYSLAQASFRSGAITNLDLLTANTSVSESSLLLLKARIDYSASVYKLKAALGQRIY